MDDLSAVLDAVRMRGQMYCRLEARAPWAMSAPPSRVATFHGVVSGDAVLQVPGEPPVPLAAGDLVVLCHGAGHAISDAEHRTAVPFRDVMATAQGSWLVRCGGHGARTVIVCGAFSAEHDGPPLLQLMPTVLQLRGNARVLALLTLLGEEGRAPSPGRDAAVSRLTEALFVEVAREWSTRTQDTNGAAIAALADARIARVLASIHKEPARTWTVAALARLGGMSRSGFALTFADRVGATPLAYVAQWRLYTAKVMLRESSHGLAQIAERTGYESEASLSKAFKRRFGLAPGAWRRQVERAA
jgi:AraC-like DNA-binding protein